MPVTWRPSRRPGASQPQPIAQVKKPSADLGRVEPVRPVRLRRLADGGQSGGHPPARTRRPDRLRRLVRAAGAVLRGRALAAGRESALGRSAGAARHGAVPVSGPGAALAAVSFAVFLAVIITIFASIRFDDALDYAAPNLTSNQLIVYAPDNDSRPGPGQHSTRPAPRSWRPTRQQADAIAAQLHAAAPLELELAISPKVAQPGSPTQNQPAMINSTIPGASFSGELYVATPALLKAYGISPSEVHPDADILTMRAGDGLAVQREPGPGLSRQPTWPSPPNATDLPGRSDCIDEPGRSSDGETELPSGSAPRPNTVITESAVKALHWGRRRSRVEIWIIQAPTALTAVQVARGPAWPRSRLERHHRDQVRAAQPGRDQRVFDDRRHRGRARRARDDGRADPRRDHRRPAHAHRGRRERPDQAQRSVGVAHAA